MTARMNAAGVPVVRASSGRGYATKSARLRAERRAAKHRTGRDRKDER